MDELEKIHDVDPGAYRAIVGQPAERRELGRFLGLNRDERRAFERYELEQLAAYDTNLGIA